VDATKAEVGAADSAENLDRCSHVNVRETIAALRSESSILAGLEDEGKIAIVGGVYDVATGEVAWLD
jgi:carbonic anhydrase